MTDTDKGDKIEHSEPTKTFKLGKWLGAAIQRVVKLVIRFPVAKDAYLEGDQYGE